jgi:hypothetical protein
MKFLLLLSAIGLCWAEYNTNTQQGQMFMSHLFEWHWVDIAQECKRYLAPNGFGGVQVNVFHRINFRVYCENGILISFLTLEKHLTSHVSILEQFSEEESI